MKQKKRSEPPQIITELGIVLSLVMFLSICAVLIYRYQITGSYYSKWYNREKNLNRALTSQKINLAKKVTQLRHANAGLRNSVAYLKGLDAVQDLAKCRRQVMLINGEKFNRVIYDSLLLVANGADISEDKRRELVEAYGGTMQ